jgi:hypothetical protein
LRPRHEPNHGGVVDEARVHSGVVTEVISGLGHAQDDVEIALNLVEEEFPYPFFSIDLLVLGVLSALVSDCSGFFFLEKVGNFTTGDETVDIFNEGFL